MHNFIPPHRFFPYLTWKDIQDLPNKKNTVIIQPIGSIEQHGHHLPIIVDSAIGVAVIGKALEQLKPEIPAYCLPPLYYGKSNEHTGFPGTITLSATTLLTVLKEIAESIYEAGFRKLALVNSHGGQPQILDIVARDLHHQYQEFMIFPLFIWKVPNLAQELTTEKEMQYGIHGGDLETSLMLSILPEQVKMELAIKEYPAGLPENSLLSMEGKLPFAWLTKELTKTGVLGDATIATKEKGDRLLTSLTSSWVNLIEDIYKFQQPQINN